MDVTSAVVDFQARAAENITWLLSARFDDYSDFDEALTGRASVAWNLGENTTLRASIGTDGGAQGRVFAQVPGYGCAAS